MKTFDTHLRVEDQNLQDLARLDTTTASPLDVVAAFDQKVPAVIHEVRLLAKDLLLYRMKEIGLTYTSRSWSAGLEYLVWQAVLDGPVRVPEALIHEVERLAFLAQGWYVSEAVDGLQVEPMFVSMRDWNEIYAEHLDRQRHADSTVAFRARIQQLESQLSAKK